ncbi:MAG: 4Fe-4S binding protein [Treponema sp.]|jgi:2-oxoglutarate ferredoxin oxidoreductase subunit delta|nr:4Fe-4S binding protein [Treponema sp.]
MAVKGKITINAELCKGCNLCVDVCPHKIIEISKDRFNQRGHHPALVTDIGKCTACALCAVICPDVAITVYKEA